MGPSSHTSQTSAAIDLQALVDDLRSVLPSAAVLTDPESLRPYECDGLSAYRQLPMAVLLPDTVEQVRNILYICNRQHIPVVARGAGTSLSGGALPLHDGVLLSLAKFNKVLEIDVNNRVARVQPGVRNLAISQAVSPYGLYYAPDPSSQIACTIGGNVAENAGGVHCLKYGLTVHNVMQIKVLTMEGELLTLGTAASDAPGYDLLALMTGSEGLLGVIVEVTVKLLPKPQASQVLLAAFNDVGNAGDAVAAIIGAGIIPAGLEMMDNPPSVPQRILSMRVILGRRRRCCCARLTATRTKWPSRPTVSRSCCANTVQARCAWRKTNGRSRVSGQDERLHSRPSDAFHQTTTAWTGLSHANTSPWC